MPFSGQVASLIESAVLADGDRAAVVYGDAVLTYRELAALVDRMAAGLRVAPGERIAVVAPNVPGLVVSLFAAWKLGAVPLLLNARLRGFELERAFATICPTVAVSVETHGRFDLAHEISGIGATTSTLAECIVIDALGNVIDAKRSPAEPAEPLSEEIAAILYTSGTTGEPKGALMSYRLAQAHAENMPAVLGDSAGQPTGLAVPATHSFGLGCMLCALAARGTLIPADVAASVEPLVNTLRDRGARVLHGSPALFARLVHVDAELPLRRGFTAGAYCPPAVLEQLDGRGMRLLNLYGMTEIGAATCCRSDDPPEVRYQTSGRPIGGHEFRIAPVGGAGDGVGEIQVRSSDVWSGYFSRPWTGEETAGDGWFRTGDLGSLDASGNLSVAGRAKEVVQVGGFNVFPAEVETFLLTHPAISRAAVIGVPHPLMGEVPQAFVVAEPHSELEPTEVVRFARAKIAGYKVPYAVRIVDELPTLPSGKPDRKELARSLQQEGTS